MIHLEQAIRIMHEGVRLTSNDNPVRAQILSSLGIACQMRHERADGAVNRHSDAFQSLVDRSISAWYSMNYVGPTLAQDIHTHVKTLRNVASIQDLLANCKFLFFQRRESFMQQTLLAKWDPDRLDAYILVPVLKGFVNKKDCFFVSHYWRTPEHPDPEGQDLQLFRQDLCKLEWSYIWVDWTCLPQSPRNENEKTYFKTMLQYIPMLIRDCALEWRFPPFEPRAWILMEMAQYYLTHKTYTETEDSMVFVSHINEMKAKGVRAVLSDHNYACTNSNDLSFIVGWLEVLTILTDILGDVGQIRSILNGIEQEGVGGTSIYQDDGPGKFIEIDKHKGVISYKGKRYEFTPVYNIRDRSTIV
jgi:hypothetical protein